MSGLQGITRKANVCKTFVELNYKIRRRVPSKELGAWLSSRCQQLGTTYVKIGQFISSRSDIFGDEFSNEFGNLRDQMAPMCPAHTRRQLLQYQELNQSITQIDLEPIASASIGQVHKAHGSKGQSVLIKIKRPNIAREITEDIGMLQSMLKIMMFFKVENVSNTQTMLTEFKEFLSQEIDLSIEQSNIVRFYNLYQQRFAGFLRIPRVVRGVCNSDVLVMEYIENIGFQNYKGDRSLLARTLMEFFIRQLVQFGYMHGDPHKGNIGISADNKLVIYDYGNMLTIDQHDRFLLQEMIYMLLIGNKYGVVRLLAELGVEILDHAAVYKYVDKYSEYMRTIDVSVFRDIHKGSNDKLPIHLNGKIVRILRVYSILEGVCRELDPTFNYLKLLDTKVSDIIFDGDFLSYKMRKDMDCMHRTRNMVFRAFDENM